MNSRYGFVLGAVVLVLVSGRAWAAPRAVDLTYECITDDYNEGTFKDYFKGNARLTVTLTKSKAAKSYTLDYEGNITLRDMGDPQYSIKDEANDPSPVKNNPKYKPRKYKDSLQFDLKEFNLDGGGVTFIIPDPLKNGNADKKKVEGRLILQAGDHFGGSMPTTCTVQAD